MPKHYLALLGLALTWGTSYILIKWGLQVYTPVQLASLRLGISTVAFLPWFITRVRSVPRRQLGLLFAVGLTGTAVPAFLYAIAQTRVSSSITGALSSLTPLFTLLVGVLFFSLRPGGRRTLGVIVGLGGALLLAFLGQSTRAGGGGSFGYAFFIFAATLCYAISSNLVGRYLQHMKPLTISAVSFFMVGLPALIWLFTGSGFLTTLLTHPGGWEAFGYIAFLSLFSTVLASIVFFRLVQWTSPLFASTVSYLIPIIALGWGFLDGEQLAWYHLLSMLLILFGVYLSRKERVSVVQGAAG